MLISFTIDTAVANLYFMLLLGRESRCRREREVQKRERKRGAKEREKETQSFMGENLR